MGFFKKIVSVFGRRKPQTLWQAKKEELEHGDKTVDRTMIKFEKAKAKVTYQNGIDDKTILLARDAARIPFFPNACKMKGLDAEKTFIKYFLALQKGTGIQSQKIVAKALELEIEAKANGSYFDEAKYYAEIIAKIVQSLGSKQ